MAEKFSEKVEQINAVLRSYGSEAVQEIKMMKDGQVIGQIRYGYKAQYVFDAVNEILQPENWRHEIVSKEIFDFQAVVEVKLFIRIAGEWLCKGSQTGQMNIVKKNVGDAYKGAVTDAIQKCFSLVSIGSDAYRGLLKAVYFSDANNKPSAQPRQPQPQRQRPAQNTQPRSHQSNPPPPTRPQPSRQPHNQAQRRPPQNHQRQALGPVIDGLSYDVKGNFIVVKGKTWGKTELLKADGFRWNPDAKQWWKEAAVH
ncbi:hypothetical protein [Desulfogranum marinum]|uniref:hypothetical protein n=1 Tax=Desulfogranum marinum TaxID=453220 RepID=UPI00196514C1|nr:hypothetical protein [Desulfogranum marinum]MBM9514255.1 hypothetical protein [Desulfogranum marinum]